VQYRINKYIISICKINLNRKNRKYIRSYNYLNRHGKGDLLSKIDEEISKTILNIPKHLFSKYIFESAIPDAEIALRQQLIFSLVYLKLNRAILLSIDSGKKLKYPLPDQWINIVEKNGLKISFFWSSIYFKLYIAKLYISGLISFFVNIIFAFNLFKLADSNKYIQFTDLSVNNLPTNNYDIKSKNIINWYINKRIISNKSLIIKHNVPQIKTLYLNGIEVISSVKIFPRLTLLNSIKYFFSMLATILHTFIDLLRGKWWHSFMLKQSLLAKRIKFTLNEQLAEEYLFSNSSMLNRPLWTYEASKRGSKVTLYFYSTNCEYFKHSKKDAIIPIGYSAMNWPNYLVWDIYQSNFLKRLNNFITNIIVVGPIWFESKSSLKKINKTKSIALFDVSPVRDSIYSTFSAPDKYYRSHNCIAFINDILEIASKYDYQIKFKTKREFTNKIELKYRKFIQKLMLNPIIKFVDPNTSAIDIIESCDMTISMPFTSTSVIAKEYGFNCSFYDPTGYLSKSDPAAHGVLLLSNIIELENWILNN